MCQVPDKEAGPLTAVVICVGKKLSKMQSELNAIAASLGADFRYLTNCSTVSCYVDEEITKHLFLHLFLGGRATIQ